MPCVAALERPVVKAIVRAAAMKENAGGEALAIVSGCGGYRHLAQQAVTAHQSAMMAAAQGGGRRRRRCEETTALLAKALICHYMAAAAALSMAA